MKRPLDGRRRRRGVHAALAAAALISALSAPRDAASEPIPARDTAQLLEKGKWGVGLLSPLRIGLADGIEADAMVIPWVMLSPNASLRIRLRRIGGVTVTGEYGLSMPTGAMWLTQGYLFPTWATSENRLGFIVVPSAGLLASWGDRGVLTGRLETAIGIPLGPSDLTPLETYAPLEMIFAPALSGYRVRIGAAYDYAILTWLRARAEANAYLIGKTPYPPRSPLYFSTQAGLDIGLGRSFRIAVGGIWWSYDGREKAVERGDDGRVRRVGVRSNDFFPTFDLIFQTP
jgi:hypothetical protein